VATYRSLLNRDDLPTGGLPVDPSAVDEVWAEISESIPGMKGGYKMGVQGTRAICVEPFWRYKFAENSATKRCSDSIPMVETISLPI